MVYRFDQFEVDDREFRLTEDGTPVQVEPKVLRLLVYLIENRNRLVRKQELLDKVWPDAMVTENALTRAIVLLRKALNEDSHVPRYLETIPTAGYRFIANVTTQNGTSTAGPISPDAPASNSARLNRSEIPAVEHVDSVFRRSSAGRRCRRHVPVPPSRAQGAHRNGHGCARRLRQLHRRPGIRRHAAAGHGGAVGAVAFPQPYPG